MRQEIREAGGWMMPLARTVCSTSAMRTGTVSTLSGGPAKAQCLIPHNRSTAKSAPGDQRRRGVRIAFTSICRRGTQVVRTIVQFVGRDCNRGR